MHCKHIKFTEVLHSTMRTLWHCYQYIEIPAMWSLCRTHRCSGNQPWRVDWAFVLHSFWHWGEEVCWACFLSWRDSSTSVAQQFGQQHVCINGLRGCSKFQSLRSHVWKPQSLSQPTLWTRLTWVSVQNFPLFPCIEGGILWTWSFWLWGPAKQTASLIHLLWICPLQSYMFSI